jgi:hypothetical protein
MDWHVGVGRPSRDKAAKGTRGRFRVVGLVRLQRRLGRLERLIFERRDSFLEELRREYSRLFLGPFGSPPRLIFGRGVPE